MPSVAVGHVAIVEKGADGVLRVIEAVPSGKKNYQIVTDRFKNLAFKAPKQSVKYPNLFFTGGSVNPGGGMPMVVLCGQNVARKVAVWDRG